MERIALKLVPVFSDIASSIKVNAYWYFILGEALYLFT
ncbi:hypothetical protein I600_1444 [Maribacter dokdonensis DSW-8]|nr:hypothetical protein I600_1444 [Maribacter dokdonensis DSW-8]